jgi:hypothetical protein
MSAYDPQRTFSVAINNREMFEVLNLFLLGRGVLRCFDPLGGWF